MPPSPVFRVSDGPVVLHDLLDKAESNFVLLWPFFCNASKIIGSAFFVTSKYMNIEQLQDYKDFTIDSLGKLFGLKTIKYNLIIAFI